MRTLHAVSEILGKLEFLNDREHILDEILMRQDNRLLIIDAAKKIIKQRVFRRRGCDILRRVTFNITFKFMVDAVILKRLLHEQVRIDRDVKMTGNTSKLAMQFVWLALVSIILFEIA